MTPPALSLVLADRFWAKVNKGDGCWIWTGSQTKQGYGVLWVGGRGGGNVRANRLSWLLETGEDPGDLWVLHQCDNPACVRPSHLFLGTAKDNSQDMANKGRSKLQQPGVRHSNAKVNAEIAAEIRSLYPTVNQHELAERFDITQAAVWQIIHNKTWRTE